MVTWLSQEGSYLAVRIAESVVEAIDADGDGVIGTSDFLRFAAHNKEIWEEGDDGERKKRLAARQVV
jgi:Ca2+-binding EF-hand superfamily protein